MTSFKVTKVALVATMLVSPLAVVALDEAERDRWLQPERVMDTVGLRPGMTVGEIGAGRGYFTVKLARRVGSRGRVLANDIDGGALRVLTARLEDERLGNVDIIHGEVEDPRLPESTLDMVFLVYALHDLDRPLALLRNLSSSLVPTGLVVVLDQDPGVTGDPHFLSAGRVRDLFLETGYEEVPVEDFLERDLLLVFRLADSG
jgi:ubiquinone/menaquinone biosynthesis C-methylase UbiE